jgi:hypothetical protein
MVIHVDVDGGTEGHAMHELLGPLGGHYVRAGTAGGATLQQVRRVDSSSREVLGTPAYKEKIEVVGDLLGTGK